MGFRLPKRPAFEMFCYSETVKEDSHTALVKARADQWLRTVGMTDDDFAERIRADRIDILIDLTMHMAHSRLLVFAHKPAPVQATYLAYCSTTGLETIDFRLTDPYLDPPAQGDSDYSEQSIRLPRCFWCYQPDPDSPPVAGHYGPTTDSCGSGCVPRRQIPECL